MITLLIVEVRQRVADRICTTGTAIGKKKTEVVHWRLRD
jgi:hypothetical protein